MVHFIPGLSPEAEAQPSWLGAPGPASPTPAAYHVSTKSQIRALPTRINSRRRFRACVHDTRNPIRTANPTDVSEGKSFILKDMIRGEFDYVKSLQQPLSSYPNLRVFADALQDDEMLAYDFMADDLLQFSKRPLSDETRRSILKGVLTGLAELHDRRIIHTGKQLMSPSDTRHLILAAGILADIKPSNILIDYNKASGNEPTITQVRISDLEDAVLLDLGKSIKGYLSGNSLWRSPESWARAKQNTPSDVYSFAVMAVYVMLDHMIFLASHERLKGEMAWRHVLWKHIEYFGDVEGLNGLLEHVG